MRARSSNGSFRLLAVAGTHVVLLGWDMPEADIRAQGVLGFAIQRRRASDGETIWMSSMKTFKSVDPDPGPGVPVSCYRHPFQTFQWADYSVSPGESYRFRLIAMIGQPASLLEGPELAVDVVTEREDVGTHTVFFNRGAVASQEYARRFQNKPPEEIGPAAFDWLSRGLVEGLERFIGQAGAGDRIVGAFFEFKSPRIYEALKAAEARGASIQVLYDADSQREGNETALEGQGMEGMVKPREHSGQFAHNKFFVLLKNGVAKEVLAGSTNLSLNGIFGHSNNVHIVRDPEIAEKYRLYWERLNQDLTVKPMALGNAQETPAPVLPWPQPIVPVFSPRPDLAALDWYVDLARTARAPVFTTFAFGMPEGFVGLYAQNDGVLRFALMEKKGNGQQFKKQAADVDRVRRLPNTVVAVGNYIKINEFDRWLAETDRITNDVNVRFIHTKYMIVDPLGPLPVLVVGSANFSKASTDTNDENMLVITGNEAVADIYLGEFMRLYSHYAFRESLTFKGATTPAAALARRYLVENPNWIDGGPNLGESYFRAGSSRSLRRAYFSGG